MDFTQIPGVPGWLGTLLSLVGIVIYGFYIKRSAKSKAEDLSKNAYEKAVVAMQTYTDILNKRLDDTEKENIKLTHTIETIYSSLRSRGIYITIDGDMIHIRSAHHGQEESSTTTRIRHKEEE